MCGELKRCNACGVEKPLSEYYFNHGKPMNVCKECWKAQVKRRRQEHPERELQTRLKTCAKKPNHKNAYMAVDAALRCGVLIKPEVCYGCGCSNTEHRIEAHHHDYAKPLEVIWLCTPCHRRMDAERRIRNGETGYGGSRRVVMKRNGEALCTFETITDAARAINRAENTLSVCLSKGSQCAGFEWAYEES